MEAEHFFLTRPVRNLQLPMDPGDISRRAQCPVPDSD